MNALKRQKVREGRNVRRKYLIFYNKITAWSKKTARKQIKYDAGITNAHAS